MQNKYPMWYMPGAMAIPITLVAPSLGVPGFFMCIIVLVLLKIWASRTYKRVYYVNDQIDKGVIFHKLTINDQLQYRRKRMILNHENVSHYVKTRKLMCLIMIPLIAYMVIYANIVWFKNQSDALIILRLIPKASRPKAAIITSIMIFVLLAASTVLAYLRVRFFASCLKEPNKPKILTEREREEKLAAAEKARESASQSNSFISAIAQKKIDEEAVEAARKKAGSGGGMISSLAHADVSGERIQMTRDEKIEADYQAELEKKKKEPSS